MSRLVRFATLVGLLVLPLGAAVDARPAAAAVGFHAAYFSESDFLTRSPGQTGQFAVGYTNTGDQAWVKGVFGQQALLATAVPIDNSTDFNAGWANNWLSANRYAAQQASLVAPGQIGFFVYSFTVPAAAPSGEHRFYGRPLIEGLTLLEDFGYYQTVNVVGGTGTVTTGVVTITGVSPAGPSINQQPVVSGNTGGAWCNVTIFDGVANVATGTSDGAGNFAIATAALATGAHTLSASAICSDGFHASANWFTYIVVASIDVTGPTFVGTGATATATGTTRRVDVTWNEAVQCSGTYVVDGVTAFVLGHTGTGAAGQAQCRLLTQPLAAGSIHTLWIVNERDQNAGNLQSPNPLTLQFAVGTGRRADGDDDDGHPDHHHHHDDGHRDGHDDDGHD